MVSRIWIQDGEEFRETTDAEFYEYLTNVARIEPERIDEETAQFMNEYEAANPPA
jgi:hypothetical protein